MAIQHPARTSSSTAAGGAKSYTIPLVALTSLFFMWGFLTCLNDILIPHLKAAFSLSYTQAALIQFCFFGAYFLVSLPSGRIVKRIGYQRGIVLGLLVAGLGCVGFYPAAGTRAYALFLGALFVLASGITLLQVAANPYVAILGKPETASSRLNLTQAFNSLGTFLAPFFGSALILSVASRSPEEVAAMTPAEQAAYRVAEASSVQVPYLGLAVALVLIAVVMGRMKLPAVVDGKAGDEHAGNVLEDRGSAWRYPHLILGAGAIFLYVGAEVSIGSFLINFMSLPEIADLPKQVAGNYLPLYWGGAMVGRFIGSALLRKVRPGTLLAVNAIIASALTLVTIALSGHAAMWTILAVGLFNSIMFPTIFTLAVDGLGRHTEQGSGVLCMAIVGGALVPLLMGYLGDHLGSGGSGIHQAFFLPALCYLYIAFYGLKGSHHALPKPA